MNLFGDLELKRENMPLESWGMGQTQRGLPVCSFE